jgi:hypothetical protein
MTKPIKPSEVEKIVPDEVIESFNELIQKYWNGNESVIKQVEVVKLISEKTGMYDSEIFDKKYLDVEPIYISAGWEVKYDEPGFNENPYPPYFRFSKK